MGSFANSIHVKHDHVEDVIDFFNRELAEAGYIPTDTPPGPDTLLNADESSRGFYIHRCENGWISILDSDSITSPLVSTLLSEAFKTITLFVLVNDSDAWYYALSSQGKRIDQFDSSGGLATNFKIMPDLIGTMNPDNEEFDEDDPRLQELDNHIEEMLNYSEEQLINDMPEEIKLIKRRTDEGTATEEQMEQLMEFVQTHTLNRINKAYELMEPHPVNDSTDAKENCSEHVNTLKSLFPNIDTQATLEILQTQPVFAEEGLERFLNLLNIPKAFANLEYMDLIRNKDYYKEIKDNMVAHLMFEMK